MTQAKSNELLNLNNVDRSKKLKLFRINFSYSISTRMITYVFKYKVLLKE